jgi:hypothetical protein
LGKTQADDERLDIATILESNELDDALWCLKTVVGRDKELRLYAVECARSIQYLMTDARSIDAVNVAERFANGQATEGELSAARNAAWAAAWDAAWAAAWATSLYSPGAAARNAAWAAAWDAARDAAREQQAMYLLLVCERIKGGE